jgi:4-carboxymuconolactone decarboxylase
MRRVPPSCCARAASGDSADAPPRSVMKSRRLTPIPFRLEVTNFNVQNDSTPEPRAVRKIIHVMQVGLIHMRETMMDTRDLYQKGLKLRREMLGSEAVDKRMNAFGAFGEPLQNIINAYAYGDVWSRPALPMATKSLAMVAMMAAAGRANELRVHIKGAIGNGATAEQIQDILLLVAMYCGIPAANEAHRIAADVLREGQAA